jgi:lipopolysaccharide export system protein LptC
MAAGSQSLSPEAAGRAQQSARGRLWRGRTPEETRKAHGAALRHSRLIRLLRKAVPVVLAIGVLVPMAINALSPVRTLADLGVDPGKLGIHGTRVRMESPRVSGFTTDRRPFELTADAAEQDITKPREFDMFGLKVKVGMADTTVNLQATSGTMYSETQMMNLRDGIEVKSSNGYTARLATAVVDMRRGTVVTEDPVDVTMLEGYLKANRMEVREGGSVAVFQRGVRMNVLLPNADAPGQGGTAAAPPASAPARDTAPVAGRAPAGQPAGTGVARP